MPGSKLPIALPPFGAHEPVPRGTPAPTAMRSFMGIAMHPVGAVNVEGSLHVPEVPVVTLAAHVTPCGSPHVHALHVRVSLPPW